MNMNIIVILKFMQIVFTLETVVVRKINMLLVLLLVVLSYMEGSNSSCY